MFAGPRTSTAGPGRATARRPCAGFIASPFPDCSVAPSHCLNSELPFTCGLPGRIVWREPENRPQPKPLSCSARGHITKTEGLEIKPLAGVPPTETGTLPEHAFSAITIAPVGLKGHCPVLIDCTAVLAIQHF